MKTIKLLIIIGIILISVGVITAQEKDTTQYIGGFRYSRAITDEVLRASFPDVFKLKEYSIDELAKHTWQSQFFKKVINWDVKYIFRKDGLRISDSQYYDKVGNIVEASDTLCWSFYLSNTIDYDFDESKMGSKTGRYIIFKIPGGGSRSDHVDAIINLSDTLLAIVSLSRFYLKSKNIESNSNVIPRDLFLFKDPFYEADYMRPVK